MATFVQMLSTLSRADVIFRCARLNHIVTNASDRPHMARQASCVSQFLSIDEARLIDRFAQEHGGDVTVFFRGSLLEILRWAVLVCDDHSNDGSTFEDPELRRTFTKVALIAGDIWGSRVYGGALSIEEGIDAARERSIGPFRKAIEGALTAPEFSHSLGRGWQIFQKLLPLFDASFYGRFTSATGLTTEEYYACCCACITQFLKPGSEATIFDANTLGSNTKDSALVRRFIALESQTLAELRQALWGGEQLDQILAGPVRIYDYKPIRERPLLRAADGRTIIVDPIFMIDKIAIGPLFHVLKFCVRQEANELFAAFGNAFERYIQDTLRRAFPRNAADLFDPLSCGLKAELHSGEQLEIDACLNYVKDLILFEIKATWPREAELTPGNAPSLLQSLRRQYGISEEADKGVAQLARLVTVIAGSKLIEEMQEFRDINRIVAVLVVHDLLLSAPGFGRFVAAEFDRALGPCQKLTPCERLKGAVNVVVPIVLTIEDIEMLEVSIEHFSMREVLLDYSDACPDRMTSFHTFLATSAKYSRRIYANRHLASQAMEPVQVAMDRLFPRPTVE